MTVAVGRTARPRPVGPPPVFEREPDPNWVEELARIAPPSDRLSWLLIHYEPGDPWKRCERWMIREMDPAVEYCNHLYEYDGPSPRLDGKWVGEGSTRKWVGNANISFRQWQLYQYYGCTSQRVWTVQGPGGGHLFEKSQAERMFLRAHGLPDEDTPKPGDLPYCEPDQRTWAKLAAVDKLRKWSKRISWEQRRETPGKAGLYVLKDWDAEYKAYQEQALKVFGDGIKEAIDSVPRGTLRQLYDTSPKHDGTPHDEEAIEERFVNATPFLHPED